MRLVLHPPHLLALCPTEHRLLCQHEWSNETSPPSAGPPRLFRRSLHEWLQILGWVRIDNEAKQRARIYAYGTPAASASIIRKASWNPARSIIVLQVCDLRGAMGGCLRSVSLLAEPKCQRGPATLGGAWCLKGADTRRAGRPPPAHCAPSPSLAGKPGDRQQDQLLIEARSGDLWHRRGRNSYAPTATVLSNLARPGTETKLTWAQSCRQQCTT